MAPSALAPELNHEPGGGVPCAAPDLGHTHLAAVRSGRKSWHLVALELGGSPDSFWCVLGLALTGPSQTTEIDANRGAVFHNGTKKKAHTCVPIGPGYYIQGFWVLQVLNPRPST